MIFIIHARDEDIQAGAEGCKSTRRIKGFRRMRCFEGSLDKKILTLLFFFKGLEDRRIPAYAVL